MFPNPLFLGITLYDIFLCLAVVAALDAGKRSAESGITVECGKVEI